MAHYLTAEASGNFPIGAANRDKCEAGMPKLAESLKDSSRARSARPFIKDSVARCGLCTVDAADSEPGSCRSIMMQSLSTRDPWQVV